MENIKLKALIVFSKCIKHFVSKRSGFTVNAVLDFQFC